MLQTKRQGNYNYSYKNRKNLHRNSVNNHKRKDIPITGIILFLLIVILVAFLLISYICQYVQIAHLKLQTSELKEDLVDITQNNRKLKLKLAQNKSLARIEKIARTQLNMIEPEKVEIVVLNDQIQKIDVLPEPEKKKVLFARIFNDLLERFGTVRAKVLD